MDVTKNVEIIDAATISDLEHELRELFPAEVTKAFSDNITKMITEIHCEKDWKNAKVSMVFKDKRFHVACGNQDLKFLIHCQNGNLESTQVLQINHLNEVIEVKEINKRTIGRAIIKYIGNEGTNIDTKKEGLRKLLQATIDYIQLHPSESVWTNAKVTVYDLEDNQFVFISGNGKHRFIVNEERGNINVVYNVNNKKKNLKAADNSITETPTMNKACSIS